MLTLNVIRPSDVKPILDNDLEIEEIRMDQDPIQKRWAYIPLYRISLDGGLLYWQILFDGMNHFEIRSGCVEGVINTERIKVDNVQNIILLQMDARHRYKLKYREGYRPAGTSNPQLVRGMKGQKYKENSITSWPVYTQPKLHGIRMLCENNGRLSMRSWLNNIFTCLTHLESELEDFFIYLPRHTTCDGELYNHDMHFSILTSTIKTLKTVKTIHPRLVDIKYHIFDINYEESVLNGIQSFDKRFEILINAFRKYVQDRGALPHTFCIVPCDIATNHGQIIQQHDRHVGMGYEGIMIKKINNGLVFGSREYVQTLYKSGKNTHILKYKQFIDEEAVILGIDNIKLKLKDSDDGNKGIITFVVGDKEGRVYPIRMRDIYVFDDVNIISSDELLGRLNGLIRKKITVRYQEVSVGGVPICPLGVPICPLGVAMFDQRSNITEITQT